MSRKLASLARRSETFLAKQRLGRSLEPELERDSMKMKTVAELI